MESLAEKKARAKNLLRQYEQDHVLSFWEELSEMSRQQLLDQIFELDLHSIQENFHRLVKNKEDTLFQGLVQPLNGTRYLDLSASRKASLQEAGLRNLSQGKTAAFLMAGGQGTRLGHPGPKGTFRIGLESGKSLFQLQAERLLNLSRRAGKSIPWYIMTSPDNHDATTRYFKENKSFGYQEADIRFFMQGTLPVLDDSGRLLLDFKDSLSLGPDGNGGCFRALRQSGALEDMRRRGVQQLFTYSVDNALVRICDPLMLGFAEEQGTEITCKAVAKTGPDEKVGVLCLRDGRPAILEYSDMPEEMKTRTLDDGSLAFSAGSIAIHLFSLDFLEREAIEALPYHLAHKKVPYLDANGERIVPDAPNAYKFEMFLFDIFPRSHSMSILEVEREAEFAPVKNADGVDSPETARILLHNLHRRWLIESGIPADRLGSREVEISPLTSYGGEGLDPRILDAKLAQSTLLL